MTTDKPLSYLSSKCVLQYLDPTLRFRISQRCPSLRLVEKAAALKLDYLYLGPAGFEISSNLSIMRHTISIMRHYPNSETPKHIETENFFGKVQYDVDQYGFPVLDATVKRASAEVFIDNRAEEVEAVRQENQADEVEWRNELERLVDKAPGLLRRQNGKLIKSKEKPNLIKLRKAMLLPFDLLRDNMEPPFQHYLKATIALDREIKKTEFLMYNRSIYEAMKNLIWKFFAGKHVAVQVDTLRISFEGVLRFPVEMKLKIRKLKIESNGSEPFDSIASILHRSSYPLESIELHGPPPLEHQIVQAAKKLIIISDPRTLELPTLTHHRVHIKNKLSPMGERHVVELMRNWLQTGRDIGTCHSFDIDGEGVKELLKTAALIRNEARLGEIDEIRDTKFPHCIACTMENNLSELNVYCVQGEYGEWNLMLKVQPKGFARRLNV